GVVRAQQPTGSVPTVTGTPAGAYITVNMDANQPQINVRGGPSTYIYPPIGVLLYGQQAPALGRSPGGDWIQISYPGVPGSLGWVYAPLVRLSPGANLPIVEPPPTPTPASTPTIDPTLAAIFIAPETATRLPTFTPPPALEIPTFSDATAAPSRVPIGLLIFGFGFVGVLGAFISFLRGGR
ncbi:MAG TPA: SH3 domain-containing protein, partial [Anaerolineales bacterium]